MTSPRWKAIAATAAINLLACGLASAQSIAAASAAQGDAHPARIVAIPPAPGCVLPYPLAALRAAAMGTTKLRYAIDAGGRVVTKEIIASSGTTPEHRLLDIAARDAVANCVFVPATDAQGRPMGGTVDTQYLWQFD